MLSKGKLEHRRRWAAMFGSPQRIRLGRRVHGSYGNVTWNGTMADTQMGNPSDDTYVEECRYKKEPWEDCDRATNTQKRKLVLKRGSGKCEPTKELTRNCKKACRYEKGAWNPCNTTANTRTRVDKIKPRSDPTCEPNRTVTKKCKSGLGCRYNRSVKWSECDPQTLTRTKTMPLVSGNAPGCESHKLVTKPCRNADRAAKRRSKQDEEEEEEEE